MAGRYRRYRKTRRTYYRKKRWTAYNSEVTVNATGAAIPTGNYRELYTVGVYGSSNSLSSGAVPSAPVSAINYYVCRCRYKGVFTGGVPASVSCLVYLAYVPNAVTIDGNASAVTGLYNSFFYRHPEYVLAWSRYDYVQNTGDTGEVSLYSKITKRLAPGDQIVVGMLYKNASTSDFAQSAAIQGTFSCYLRTN